MSVKVPVGFLGYGTRALDALMAHGGFEVRYFFAPQSRLNKDVYDARKRYGDRLQFQLVKGHAQLLELFRECQDVSLFVMNACPIILKKDAIEAMQVYNIHPGNLHYNRGHQPHLWTVLLGEEQSEIVLHTVTTGIDEGSIIAKKQVPITGGMNAGEVLDLLEDEIPYLLDQLYQYLTDGAFPVESVTGGGYRPVMGYDDYRIDPEQMDQQGFLEDLDRKIRTRSMHHGAFFYYEDERVYVDQILFEEELEAPVNSSGCLVEFHGSVAFLQKGNKRYVLNVKVRKKRNGNE